MRDASDTSLGDAAQPIDSTELAQIDALLPSVYQDLHELAGAVIQRRQTIDSARATSLIQDVYVRFSERGVQFKDRSHFLCLAAKAMRFVLVDRVRRLNAAKRGGGHTRRELSEVPAPAVDSGSLMAVDDALKRLAAFDERKARIIELRFFGGFSLEEAADVLKISRTTIKREWTLARAWLFRELGDGQANKLPLD